MDSFTRREEKEKITSALQHAYSGFVALWQKLQREGVKLSESSDLSTTVIEAITASITVLEDKKLCAEIAEKPERLGRRIRSMQKGKASISEYTLRPRVH